MPLTDGPTDRHATRVGMLFSRTWAESALTDTLARAGMLVVSYHDAVTLASGVLGGAIDVVLIEDHDRHFHDSMTTLRFRGATAAPVLAVGDGSAGAIGSALQLGAADYIARGDTMQSMPARVHARLALSRQGQAAAVLRVGDCWIEASSRSLQSPVGETQLTAREFALAWLLFEQPGQVVAMSALSQQAWGRDASIAKRTIEQHVSRLRAKLAAACDGTVQQVGLHAVHNIGYRLVVSCVDPMTERRRAAEPWTAASIAA